MQTITSADDVYDLTAVFNDGMETAISPFMLVLHEKLIRQHSILNCELVRVSANLDGTYDILIRLKDGRRFRDIVRTANGIQYLTTTSFGNEFLLDEFKAMRPTREVILHLMQVHTLVGLTVNFL